MVRHIVLFKFLEEGEGRSKAENLAIAKSMLENLQGKIPTLKASEVRLNDEKASKSNYDMVLIADYDSFEDLNEYIVHPLHKAVGEFMKNVRESRSCVDFEF